MVDGFMKECWGANVWTGCPELVDNRCNGWQVLGSLELIEAVLFGVVVNLLTLLVVGPWSVIVWNKLKADHRIFFWRGHWAVFACRRCKAARRSGAVPGAAERFVRAEEGLLKEYSVIPLVSAELFVVGVKLGHGHLEVYFEDVFSKEKCGDSATWKFAVGQCPK